jgi:hypothetical protein
MKAIGNPGREKRGFMQVLTDEKPARASDEVLI